MLSTLSQKHPGWPFGSLMPYAGDEFGRPVFLISSMAMHTHNLRGDARASLLVTQPDVTGDPLGAGRVTLMGRGAPVADNVRDLYLSRYESARSWVDYGDFAFYRMEIEDVYFIGGFGVMGWITAGEYSTARPDPLAHAAPSIVSHVNVHHAGDLVLLARDVGAAGAREAAMTAVDRLGFELRVKTAERIHGARVAFPREVTTPEECRTAFLEVVRESRLRPRCE